MSLVHRYLLIGKMGLHRYEDTKSAYFKRVGVARQQGTGSNRVRPHGGLRRGRGRRNYAWRVHQHQQDFFPGCLRNDRLGVAELEEISL